MQGLLHYFLSITVALAAHQGLGKTLLDGRIVGGEEVSILDYPYQVSVEDQKLNKCGGAIIARTWILSTAYCIIWFGTFNLTVRVGTSYSHMGGDIYNVTNVVVHSNFSISENQDFDISLVQLDRPISLSNSAQIVRLPISAVAFEEGTVGTVTGWGSTSEGGSKSNILRAVELPIISRSVCRDIYYYELVSDRMLCVGPYEGGRGACSGDGGAPLVIDSVLSGLSSWSTGCGRPHFPALYTNVGALRDWITEQTGI